MGLVDAHAYSLISAHKIGSLKLIKIRNPWGSKEWNGDWSDNSTLWTDDLKQKLEFESKDDGIFFISYEDYMKFFYITTICKYVTGGDHSYVEDEHQENKFCVERFSIQ